jgi:thiosulfate/3-mercaptopyruvate sulfurtransferase
MQNHKISSRTSDVVDAAQLLDAPNENRLFLDVRLGEPADELKSYRDGHIHGAVYAQIRDVFAGKPTASSGNLPLPAIEDLQRQLRAWGVDPETELVVYGPSPALAARGWWVLRWAGLRNVKVLDGGMKAWITQGGPLAQGDHMPARRAASDSLVLVPGHMPQISVEEVEALGREVVLIDARDENSFLAGAIPYAANLPSAEQWTPGSTLRTVDEIGALYERAGAMSGAEVVVYCGGGVLSALSVLTLSAWGPTPRLFVGSWSEWNKSAARLARSVAAREAA